MAHSQCFCDLFGLLYTSYLNRYLNDLNDEDEDEDMAAKTLDNDMALLLNDEQPLCTNVSKFFENNSCILEKFRTQVPASGLLVHMNDVWSMLDSHTQVRIFSTLFMGIQQQ